MAADKHCSDVYVAYRGLKFGDLDRALATGDKLWKNYLKQRKRGRTELQSLQKDLLKK